MDEAYLSYEEAYENYLLFLNSSEGKFDTYMDKSNLETEYHRLRGDLYDEEYYWDKEYQFNDEIVEQFERKINPAIDFLALLKLYSLEEYAELFREYQKKWFMVNFASNEMIIDKRKEALDIVSTIEMLQIIWNSEKSESGVEVSVKNINDKSATLNDKELSKAIKSYLLEKCNRIIPNTRRMTYSEAVETLSNHKADGWLKANGIEYPELINHIDLRETLYILSHEYVSNHSTNQEITLEYLKKTYLEYLEILKNNTSKKGAIPYNRETGELALRLYNLYHYNINEKLSKKEASPKLSNKNSSYKFIYEYLCYWGIIKDVYDKSDEYHKTSNIKSIVNQAMKYK